MCLGNLDSIRYVSDVTLSDLLKEIFKCHSFCMRGFAEKCNALIDHQENMSMHP